MSASSFELIASEHGMQSIEEAACKAFVGLRGSHRPVYNIGRSRKIFTAPKSPSDDLVMAEQRMRGRLKRYSLALFAFLCSISFSVTPVNAFIFEKRKSAPFAHRDANVKPSLAICCRTPPRRYQEQQKVKPSELPRPLLETNDFPSPPMELPPLKKIEVKLDVSFSRSNELEEESASGKGELLTSADNNATPKKLLLASHVDENNQVALRLARAKVLSRRKASLHSTVWHGSGDSVASKLLYALRNTTGAASASLSNTLQSHEDKENGFNNSSKINSKKEFVNNSMVRSVIQNLLELQRPEELQTTRKSSSLGGTKVDQRPSESSAAFSSFRSQCAESTLSPGTVLTLEVANDDEDHSDRQGTGIKIRLATPNDDLEIACLRLSVFSEFSSDSLQHQFRVRSCQALQHRRLRGATCLVAEPEQVGTEQRPSSILGSVECSFHEFFGTRLGRRRPRNSILYITEVAVHPGARRRGVGWKLLQGCDVLAKARGAETLYLHVDVANQAAMRLYQKAGYRVINFSEENPMFLEFTTSLNLHPGATLGRDHFLLFKDLVPQPTWLDDGCVGGKFESCETRRGLMTFEIPA